MSEYNTQSTTYTAGYVTAYGAAKRGGYTGTYDEFCAAIAGMAGTVEDLENFSVVINTLSPGSQATASYADGVLTLGVPQGAKGDKGDKGDTGEVSQADLDAAIEEVSDDIAGLKNDLNQFPNGNYPQMGAGYANQLVSGLKKEDSTPYNFRAVPYDATLEEVEKIVGGTVAWNQLVDANTESVTVISGNKAYKNIGGTASIVISDGTASSVTGGTDIVTDITQMLDTAIADYVLSLETATAGAGVAWLKTHFPKQFDSGYQAYDAGTLKSIEGLSAKKTVGFNQWDEELANGYYWGTQDGVATKMAHSERSCSTNLISVMPNTTYYFECPYPYNSVNVDFLIQYCDASGNLLESPNWSAPNRTFTTPSGCYKISFTLSKNITYNHDICINLSDPTKNGTYEPYEAHSYALDSDVMLRGIPKVDASGNLYYDGDEYLPDGTVNRRYREIDFDGSEEWSLQSINSSGIANFSYNLGANNTYTNGDHAVCNRFTAEITPIADTTKEGFMLAAGQYLYIRISSSKADTVTGFKTWLASNPTQIMYELATPTTETADSYQTPQIISPDGTEEYIYTDGAFELPVGHSSEYPVNVSGQLDDILDTPSANGTYTLKATVTDGAVAYSWVADA